jgi:uncharacterized repeat protein (TIGR03833 family)
MNVTNRVKISPGIHVLIVLKKDQRSGKLTEGIVKDILTKSATHPHLGFGVGPQQHIKIIYKRFKNASNKALSGYY